MEQEMIGTASYSPEDNKCRLYPFARLDKETYTRVKSAGFGWAPKQGLFFATWAPGREDLLIELCGEIGDEDKSLVARAEERAERFENYSEKRLDEAESTHKSVQTLANGIPLGQPILVGHHSERHARKDAEKIDNGMRKAVKLWETSKYWEDRAQGALANAKYKELPAVRARRIKTIEADLRKQERYVKQYAFTAKFWRGELTLKNKETGETKPFEVNYENAVRFSGSDSTHISRCFLLADYPRNPPASQYEGEMGIYSALGGGDGIEHAIITVEQAKEIVLRVCDGVARRAARWIAHYNNRLTYERAMLKESGGLETDKVGPEEGGACKCWASHRGGYSYIVKVNKVSVSVLDNWGNGGGNFRRNIPFDKLREIMTASEVADKRSQKLLVEFDDKTGFMLLDSVPTPAPKVAQADEGAKKFEDLKDTIKAGGVKVVAAPQLFPTPPDLAKELVKQAHIQVGQRVLEPSVGTGNLLRAIIESGVSCDKVGVEINGALAQACKGLTPDPILCVDFLECVAGELGLGYFDRIVMNPPFAEGADIAHVTHAMKFLKPGGVLVAIMSPGFTFKKDKKSQAFAALVDERGSWKENPEGAFKSSGTNVRTVMVTLIHEGCAAEEVAEKRGSQASFNL